MRRVVALGAIPFRSYFFGRLCVVAICVLSTSDISTAAEPPPNVSLSLLQYGGSVAHLVWVASEFSDRSKDNGNRYTLLADDVKHRIELGRATVAVSTANFKVISTSAAYIAVTDPEPLTRAVAMTAAWGAKKTGEWLGEKVTTQVNSDALGVVSRALNDSKMTPNDFIGLSDDEVKQRVDELRIGGQSLKAALADVPGGLSMLEGYVLELKQNENLAVLNQVKANGRGIQEIKDTLRDDQAKLTDYADRLGKKLDAANHALADIKVSTDQVRVAMTAVADDLKGNSRALGDLAEVTYMGWSTDQKLAAMRSDLFPNIKGKARDDLITQLTAESAQEHSVARLNDIAGNIGNLAKTASNLGIDPNLATNLQGAQIVVQGITGFVSGNPLAAMATLSSLTSLGKPDPTMAALAAINKKLDIIIDLQKKTLQAISDLSDQMVRFHKEEMAALNRIEQTVLANNALLQQIALKDWEPCEALLSNFAEINDLKSLTAILDDGQSTSRFPRCYDTYVDSLDAKFKSGEWAAQRIDMITFPAEGVVSNPEYQTQIRELANAKVKPYMAVRTYLLLKLDADEASGNLEESLVRLAQPVTTVRGSSSLSNALASPSVHARLAQFKCGDDSILHDGVRAVLCYHARDDAPPNSNQWPKVINATLLGPQAYRLIDEGLQIAVLSDFFIRPARVRRDVFVPGDDVKAARTKGLTKDMQEALNEGKGLSLLRRLKWVADALVLQESMLSGSYMSELFEAELYDTNAHALKSDRAQMTDRQKAAADAIAVNPILARNTVMLAMRHAIRDSLGGDDAALKYGYRFGTYHMAIVDFGTGDGCSGVEFDRAGLNELFPNWSFDYRVTTEDTDKESTLKSCVAAANDQRRGLYVKIGDVVVAAPSPLALYSGSFEVSDGLRRALQYRDAVSQAIIDHTISQSVKGTAAKLHSGDGQVSSNSLARDFLNHAYRSE